MGKTMIEKIIGNHSGLEVRPGDIVDMAIDFRVARDFGGANVVKNLENHNQKILDPSRTAFTFDCNPTGSDQQYAANQQQCRIFADRHQIPVYDIDRGIGTHLAIDRGWIGPGGTFVSTDSHANILGSIGAFGQGMGDTDIAYAFAEGKIWFKTPGTVKIRLEGVLPPACTAKDLTLMLLRHFGANGLLGVAAELDGPVIEKLALHERITIASMATEMGGIILLIPPSESVIAFCKKAGAEFNPVYADEDAKYEREVTLDVSNLEPLLSRPGHPEDVVPVSRLKGMRIDSVFIGSCTNGRYEDLQQAARVLQGKTKASHVILKIVPATDAVWQRCMREGLFEIFKQAGALISNAGCAGCAAGQVGQNGPGEITISTGNRNFAGKQGKGDVYLASPATAAASAIAGCIVSADHTGTVLISMKPKKFAKPKHQKRKPVKRTGRPTRLKGRVWVIRMDNIDTDMIYHNRHLAVTELREMGQYTFGNLKGWEDFPEKARPGDMIVTGENFGCGSSRQQAVDCFKSLGVQLIVARSFGAIFERNAINSGFPIITSTLIDRDIVDGETITCDLSTGEIQIKNDDLIKGDPFSKVQMDIYQRGGLL